MSAKKKKSSHTGKKILSIGALAVGAYYLYGSKDAKKNRKKAKSWMLKAKAEALEAVEKLKDVDQEQYERIIDKVETKYKKLKTVDNKDLLALGKELRGHWKDIEKEFSGSTKKTTTKKRAPAKKKK